MGALDVSFWAPRAGVGRLEGNDGPGLGCGNCDVRRARHADELCLQRGQELCSSSGFFASLGILLLVYLAILVIGIIAAVKVVTKAGYSGSSPSCRSWVS